LAIDFRPPSAGIGNYSGISPSKYGWQYHIMIDETLDALDTIAKYLPNYNASVGYELTGFVWFQGWNDVLDWDKVKEYESNLIHLIRDVRIDLDAPNLPIGTIFSSLILFFNVFSTMVY
jgi:Carbohydrate esterase, sialic acid-specific acetylesterase